MKTLTITLHDTDNCGSSLQAFALQQFLLKNGIENEIIDYTPQYLKYNGSKIRAFAKKVLFFFPTIKKDRKFKLFKKEHLKVTTEKYFTLEELKNAKLTADCFITGSDQLWNDTFMCGRDPAYYLGFTDENKVAYAVSLGKEKVSLENKKTIATFCSNYKWISVREPSSIAEVSSVTKVPVKHVCDPVFLNTRSTYSAIARKVKVSDKYILVYLAQAVDKEAMNLMLACLKEKLNCKTILIGTCVKKCKCDVHLKSASPEEFLYLIENAEYVISNSFHATMFSLIFQKQFSTLLPKDNSARIVSVLEDLGLQSHGLEKPHYADNDITAEEYEVIAKKLDNFSRESGKALLQQLGNLC